MFTQNLVLESVIFIVVCIILFICIYYKNNIIEYFIKNKIDKESLDDLINRVKRSESIESFVSEALSIVSSVKSEKNDYTNRKDK